MKYFLLFILLSCTSLAEYVENVQENSFDYVYKEKGFATKDALIVFTYDSQTEHKSVSDNLPTKGIPTITKTIDLSKIKPMANGMYVLGKNNGLMKFTVTGLVPSSLFSVYSYKMKDGKYEVNTITRTSTLAREPKESPTGIIFKNTDTDHLYITWKDALNAEGSLLLVSKDKPPIPPKDGKLFHPNPTYGTDSSVNDGMTYSLFAGRKDYAHFIKIDNLRYGTYYFQVYSYNGGLGDINYNTQQAEGNPRSVTMKLPPPELDDDSDFLGQTFEINWEKVEGATTYEVEAAYDPDFVTFVENYNTVDVGNTAVYEIVTSDPEKKMYVRVRAKNGRNISDWSNIIEVVD